MQFKLVKNGFFRQLKLKHNCLIVFSCQKIVFSVESNLKVKRSYIAIIDEKLCTIVKYDKKKPAKKT